jgi:hypothetical protein
MATTAAHPAAGAAAAAAARKCEDDNEEIEGIRFVDYRDESQLEHVMSLVGRDLSEPYSGELGLIDKAVE